MKVNQGLSGSWRKKEKGERRDIKKKEERREFGWKREGKEKEKAGVGIDWYGVTAGITATPGTGKITGLGMYGN